MGKHNSAGAKTLAVLQQAGAAGISSAELQRQLKRGKDVTYATIYYLKHTGHDIQLVDGRYYYRPVINGSGQPAAASATAPTPSAPELPTTPADPPGQLVASSKRGKLVAHLNSHPVTTASAAMQASGMTYGSMLACIRQDLVPKGYMILRSGDSISYHGYKPVPPRAEDKQQQQQQPTSAPSTAIVKRANGHNHGVTRNSQEIGTLPLVRVHPRDLPDALKARYLDAVRQEYYYKREKEIVLESYQHTQELAIREGLL